MLSIIDDAITYMLVYTLLQKTLLNITLKNIHTNVIVSCFAQYQGSSACLGQKPDMDSLKNKLELTKKPTKVIPNCPVKQKVKKRQLS